jgi:hypothetical protein
MIKKILTWVGLLIGFLPSPVFVYFVVSAFYQSSLKRSFYLPAFIFAMLCCLVSGFLFAGKKNSVAVVLGTLLLLLNVCSSLLLGCGAALANE